MLIPAALVTAAHFAISLSTNCRRYSGDRRVGATAVTPVRCSFACIPGVSSVATVGSLSRRMIAAGVSLGKKKALQTEAVKLVSPCSCADARVGKVGERSSDKIDIAFTALLSIGRIASAGRAHW